MDDAETTAACIMVVMQHVNTAATAAAADLAKNCCVESFESLRIHAEDCSVSSRWNKQGSLSLHVLEDFGSRWATCTEIKLVGLGCSRATNLSTRALKKRIGLDDNRT